MTDPSAIVSRTKYARGDTDPGDGLELGFGSCPVCCSSCEVGLTSVMVCTCVAALADDAGGVVSVDFELV